MKIPRPSISTLSLNFFTTAYIFAVCNKTFWVKGLRYFSDNEGALYALGMGLFTLHLAGLTCLSQKYLIKPAYIFLVILSASAAYFVDTYGIVIDDEMIRNSVSTTFREAQHLITPDFVVHMLLFALIPAGLIVLCDVKYKPFKAKFWTDTVLVVISLIITITIMGMNYQTYASIFRQKRDFMGSLHPGATISEAVKFVQDSLRDHNIQVQPLGMDATKGSLLRSGQKPVITIVVAGETARTQNFSLNGYKRETNPALAKQDIISFSNASSCGTATATSLPCMFSVYTRSQYSHQKSISTQSLVDVLTHAGLEVMWWDNNTGSKGIADRIPYEQLAGKNDPRYCKNDECNDGILLEKLKKHISTITKDSVIVLHMIGSHGPAYYLRYPKKFEIFTPPCNTSQFSQCSQQEIINSYDNTILYTDHILSEIIELLKFHEDQFISSMVYVSDHGESLGENGLYLHGFPYLLAPETQTKIPFIVWLSDGFKRLFQMEDSCLQAKKNRPISHDYLFHSVLGMMDIQTSVYESKLDLFAKCHYSSGA